jgi:hypothetical protein
VLKILTKSLRAAFSLRVEEIKCKLFRLALFIPLVKKEVDKEAQKMEADCFKKYSDARKGKLTPHLPDQGLQRKDILQKVEVFTAPGKKHYKEGGFTCGALFTKDFSHWEFVADVMKDCITANPLHIDEYIYIT